MNVMDLIADACQGNLGMLKMLLADFSDADMFVRPVPGANHAAWQLGHLIGGEYKMVSAIRPGAMPELPAGFAEKYTAQTSKLDDPAAFVPKGQLLELAEKMRAASVRWIRSLTPEEMAKPTPEPMRSYAPTVAALVMLLMQHVAMHVGQIQVIRRKLGKAVLF